jgi:hypothetical protein
MIIIDARFVQNEVSSFFRRCEAAKLMGGIPLTDIVEGKTPPEGWIHDSLTDYYVPSIAALDLASDAKFVN